MVSSLEQAEACLRFYAKVAITEVATIRIMNITDEEYYQRYLAHQRTQIVFTEMSHFITDSAKNNQIIFVYLLSDVALTELNQ